MKYMVQFILIFYLAFTKNLIEFSTLRYNVFPQIFNCSLAKSILKHHLFSFLNNMGLFGLIACYPCPGQHSRSLPVYQVFTNTKVKFPCASKLRPFPFYLWPTISLGFSTIKGTGVIALTFCLNSSNRFGPEVP